MAMERMSRHWTQEEKNDLERFLNEGKSAQYISRKLKRPAGGIYQQATRMELKGWNRHWTEQEEIKLLRLIEKGCTLEEIGKELDKKPGSVKSKLYRMRQKGRKAPATQPEFMFDQAICENAQQNALSIEYLFETYGPGMAKDILALKQLGFVVEDLDEDYIMVRRRR